MNLRDLYKYFAWKPSLLKRLIKKGMIADGKIIQTKITPEGIEQKIEIVPVQPIKFINLEIEI